MGEKWTTWQVQKVPVFTAHGTHQLISSSVQQNGSTETQNHQSLTSFLPNVDQRPAKFKIFTINIFNNRGAGPGWMAIQASDGRHNPHVWIRGIFALVGLWGIIHFHILFLSSKEPQSVQRTTHTDKRQPSFANGRIGRKEINNKPSVFLLPPRTLVSPLRHKKHSAGWISVTKLSRGEALQQPGRDKAAYPQGRSSAAVCPAGSLAPFIGCEFHLCEKITLIFWA